MTKETVTSAHRQADGCEGGWIYECMYVGRGEPHDRQEKKRNQEALPSNPLRPETVTMSILSLPPPPSILTDNRRFFLPRFFPVPQRSVNRWIRVGTGHGEGRGTVRPYQQNAILAKPTMPFLYLFPCFRLQRVGRTNRRSDVSQGESRTPNQGCINAAGVAFLPRITWPASFSSSGGTISPPPRAPSGQQNLSQKQP